MSTNVSKKEIPSMPPGVGMTLLENGLTIIVREDHNAPVVSVQAWAMAGSIHEGNWLGAGLSHVLEHMLFKGTTTRPGSRIDQEVQEAGGYMNAYTSFDRTVYHIDVPNTGTTVAIDILCDIMQNATLPAEELAKELDVIRREMDMGQDDPSRRSGRRLFETAYTRSPYRFTIIGYPDIFNELKPEIIRGYYRDHYAPNNCFFVVAGDVNPEAVVQQIRSAYVHARARPMAPSYLSPEPRQTASREVVEESAIELGHVHMAWHIPELRHQDVPALDVLAMLLGGGRSSRLFQQVREKAGLVHHVDAWTYSPGMPGLFGVSAMVDGGLFADARNAILGEIERVKERHVLPAELQKAVKQFVAGMLSTRKTMEGQAQNLGSNWLAARDLNFSERYLAAVQCVTLEDIQRVARLYLAPENRTTYALLPEGTAPPASAHVESTQDHPIQAFTLPNGLRLLVKEDNRLPLVEFRAVFQGGVLAETPANNGATVLLAKMLLKGTQTRNAETIANEIESLGGHLDSYGGNNSFGVNAEVLSGDFSVGLGLLSDVILNPSFPSAELEREKVIQQAGIRAQRDELLKSASLAMRKILFDNAGYGLDSLGTEETVGLITPDTLRALHQAWVCPNRCVLAVFGDVKAAEVRKAVAEAFQGWDSCQAPDAGPSPLLPARLGGIHRVEEKKDKKQAVLVIGFAGTTMASEDRHALDILQECCSDLGSRLFLRIREQLGLAYYVGAQNFAGLVPGYFAFYTGTEPGKVAQVEQELMAEASLLRTEGLSPDELKRAKAKIIGQKKIARADLGNLAATAALDELYGLGWRRMELDDARYESVTLEQVKTVAQKYLRNDACVVSLVCPDSAENEESQPEPEKSQPVGA